MMTMRLSTQTSVLATRFGYEQAIRMIADSGFDCFDFSMGSAMRDNDTDPLNLPDWQKTARALRRVADSCGIVCNQAHAPFRGSFGSYETTVQDAIMEERIHRSIQIASILGAECIVIHPIRYSEDSKEMISKSIEFIRRLLPDSYGFNVNLAVENTYTTRSSALLC